VATAPEQTFASHATLLPFVGKAGGNVLNVVNVAPPSLPPPAPPAIPPAIGSCYQVKQANPSAANGYYDLELTTGATIQAYCEMEYAGGGWTLIQALKTNYLTTPSCDNLQGAATTVPSGISMTGEPGTSFMMPCDQVNAIRQAGTDIGLTSSDIGYWVTTPGSGDTGKHGAETFGKHGCEYVLNQDSSTMRGTLCADNQWILADAQAGTWCSGGYWWDATPNYYSFKGHCNEGDHGTGSTCYTNGRGLGWHSGTSLAPFHRGWCSSKAWGVVFAR